MTNEEIRIGILSLSLIISNGISIFLYLKNRSNMLDEKVTDKLFKLQDLAINKPFLEDQKFIQGRDAFRAEYDTKNELDYDLKSNVRYLQYEQYCEMLFNFASDTFCSLKSEEALTKKIDFKSWCRTHKNWWNNPLVPHSNHDTYDKAFCDMVERWLK